MFNHRKEMNYPEEVVVLEGPNLDFLRYLFYQQNYFHLTSYLSIECLPDHQKSDMKPEIK